MIAKWSLFVRYFDTAPCRSGCKVGTPAEATHVLPGAALARYNVYQAP